LTRMSVVLTLTSEITIRTRVIPTPRVCDYECDYNTHECDYDTYEGDLYTQELIFNTMRVILT
jgi:hypothetical protein